MALLVIYCTKKCKLDSYFFTEACTPANIGSDFVYNGNYYKKLDNPSNQNYDTSTETCRSQGGTLPTLDTEQGYNDAKIIKSKSRKSQYSKIGCNVLVIDI